MLRKANLNAGIWACEFMAQPIADKLLLGSNLVRNTEFGLIRPGDPQITEMPDARNAPVVAAPTPAGRRVN